MRRNTRTRDGIDREEPTGAPVWFAPARRAVRRVTHTDRARWVGRLSGVVLGVIALVGVVVANVPDAVAAIAALGIGLLALVKAFADVDECPACTARVDVAQDRFCSSCATSLETLPYRPAELEGPTGVEQSAETGGVA